MTASRVDDDIPVNAFVQVLMRLDAHRAISDEYEKDVPQRSGVWWTSQKEHMIAWFGAQSGLGTGKFMRQAPNKSARTTYNRLLCPAAFVWMAEALGEESAIVKAAADAARAEPNPRKRSGVLRAHLPWARISELARQTG